ncbi:hydantoinase/oxoprolinase N-terminal domain-containing protein, partial [Chloroflexota bacterium]
MPNLGNKPYDSDTHYRVGIDTGGTFSDLVVFNEVNHEFSFFKLPSTPNNPSLAVKEGIQELFNQGFHPEQISFLSHGTTVGTNALLEEEGAKVGVLLTEGFRGINDVDQSTASGAVMYDLYYPMQKLLVSPRMCREIHERVDYKGNILTPLDQAQSQLAIEDLIKKQHIESVAVCLLFS